MLTLHRLLGLVASSERPVRLAIETKHPTRYAGLVERRLVETLDEYGWAHPRLGTHPPVRVMSFSWLSLRRMRSLAPSLERVFLMERVPVRLRDGSLPEGARIAGPSIDVVRAHPRYVERAHRRGHQVHVWTVDDDADVQLCLDLGVDAIITNRPAAVRDAGRDGPLRRERAVAQVTRIGGGWPARPRGITTARAPVRGPVDRRPSPGRAMKEVAVPVPAAFTSATESVVLPARASAVGLARTHVAAGCSPVTCPSRSGLRRPARGLGADGQRHPARAPARGGHRARGLAGQPAARRPRVRPTRSSWPSPTAGRPGTRGWSTRPLDADGGRGLGIVATLTSAWGVEGAGSEHQLVWAVLRSS